MDRGAAIVIGFFVLNGERNNETKTLILRVLIRIFVPRCNLTVTKKSWETKKNEMMKDMQEIYLSSNKYDKKGIESLFTHSSVMSRIKLRNVNKAQN